MRFDPDCDYGKLKSVLMTLTNADTVYTAAIPTWARGFRLRPNATVRFAIGEDPPAAEATKAGSAALTDLGIGDYAMSGEWENRLLPDKAGSSYTLRLLCDEAAKTCYIVFWGG